MNSPKYLILFNTCIHDFITGVAGKSPHALHIRNVDFVLSEENNINRNVGYGKNYELGLKSAVCKYV